LEIVRKDNNMSDNVPYVRDLLDTTFVPLDARGTVVAAKELLEQAGRTYGVVISPDGVPIGLTTVGALSSVPDSRVAVGEFLGLPAFIVDADVLLDQAVSFSAQTFVENPEMSGLVVEENGKVIGILTRQTARKYAQRIRTRGGDITELAGDPQSLAKYFVCPNKDYSKLISQYDPDNPPTCPNDGLVLVKQSR
jgi:hypothetical protein